VYPKPEEVLYREGGIWHKWEAHIAEYRATEEDVNDTPKGIDIRKGNFRVHAIRFSGGAIFDTRNGWRRTTTRMMPAPQVPVSTIEEVSPGMGTQFISMAEEKVNHPSHYGGDTVYETIKVLDAWGITNPLVWNAVKYLSRAHRKGNYVEDLKKARWYLDREIARNTPTIERRDESSGDEQLRKTSESGAEQNYSSSHRGFAVETEEGERR
jgi:hypothetical protein